MENCFLNSPRRYSKAWMRRRLLDWFPGYLDRLYPRGAAGNAEAARRFDSTPKAVERWRAGLGLPRAELVVLALVFEMGEAALDVIDPEGR